MVEGLVKMFNSMLILAIIGTFAIGLTILSVIGFGIYFLINYFG